jgi:hypothetical protein
VFRLESESIEIQRDAKFFRRMIRQGKLTLDEARAEILFTVRQVRVIRQDHDARILEGVLRRRVETWNMLIRLLSTEARRKQAPVETAPLKRKAASAS